MLQSNTEYFLKQYGICIYLYVCLYTDKCLEGHKPNVFKCFSLHSKKSGNVSPYWSSIINLLIQYLIIRKKEK